MIQRNTNFKNGLLVAHLLIPAMEFILDGSRKPGAGGPTSDSPYIPKFVSWHYPAWLLLITAIFGLLSAFFQLSPRRDFRRASILLILSAGLLLTYIFNRNAHRKNGFMPLRLVLTGTVTWITLQGQIHTHPVNNHFTRH